MLQTNVLRDQPYNFVKMFLLSCRPGDYRAKKLLPVSNVIYEAYS